jgi:hypothetical protein
MTKKALTIILSLILLLPVLIYFTVWNYYAINIPKWDDHALKTFILEYAHAPGWKNKIRALFDSITSTGSHLPDFLPGSITLFSELSISSI